MRRSLLVNYTKARPCLILYLLTSFFINEAGAQVQHFNFSNFVGDYYTPGSSTNFLPAAPDGTAQVLVSDGGGGFSLTKPGTSIGSGSELQMFCGSGSSRNKMGIFGYTPGTSSYVKFTMMFTGNSGGDWFFYAGSGGSFLDDNAVNPNEAFTGIWWNIDDMGNVNAYVHTASGWIAFADGTFMQDREYTIELFSNNNNTQLSYDKSGGHNLDGGTCDIWVNDNMAMHQVEKMSLPDFSSIDSWMIYGENSNNNGMMAIDDVDYSNSITMKTLPVRFSHFSAQASATGIQLYWENSTEDNILKYDIERSSDARQFIGIGQQAPAINNGGTASYRFTDPNPVKGIGYYRIRSVERDGSIAYSPVMRINTSAAQSELHLYPNPVRDRKIFVELSAMPKGSYEIIITDAMQRPCVRRSIEHGNGAQTESLELPASLPRGVYQVLISSKDKTYNKTIVVN